MQTCFQLTRVTPGIAEGVTATIASGAMLDKLTGRTVWLSRRPVGKVQEIRVYKEAGSAHLITAIDDMDARNLLTTGCLSSLEVTPQGDIELRDRPTDTGSGFACQQAVGASELRKSFHHAPEYSGKDIEAEKDARLQDGLRKQFTALTLPFFGAGNSARGIGLTPLEFRKAVSGGRHRGFRSHNG